VGEATSQEQDAESVRMLAEFLRRKAAECDEMRRNCYDLDTIQRLRLMADELRAKANEIDGKKSPPLQG